MFSFFKPKDSEVTLSYSLTSYGRGLQKSSPSDAGIDILLPDFIDNHTEKVNTTHWIIDTGVSLDIPKGYFVRIVGRSSTFKRLIDVREGTVDNEYTGTIKLMVHGRLVDLRKLRAGERIAQLIVTKQPKVNIKKISKVKTKSRGSKGFGSTGK